MNSHRSQTRLYMVTALFACVGLRAYAGPITAESHSDFTRLSFAFEEPVKLTVGGGGNSVILTFDKPLSESALKLQPKLEDLVYGVQQSADRKQVILNLKKNYRVRQFVSSNTVGIDLMGALSKDAMRDAGSKPESPKAAPAAPAPAPVIASKPVANPPPKPEEKPKLPTVARPAPVSAPAPAPAPKIVEKPPVKKAEAPAAKIIAPTAKPEAKPVSEKPVAEKPAPAPESGEAKVIRTTPPSILTTKKTEPSTSILTPVAQDKPAPASQEEKPSPPAPAPKETPHAIAQPAKPNPVMTTKPVGEGAIADEDEPDDDMLADMFDMPSLAENDVTVPEIKASDADPQPQTAAEATAPQGPFLVGVRPTKDGTEMDFPFTARTAAAVFERGPEIWLVFSKAVNANTELLRTVLPKAIIKIDQFAYEGATVLRLTTDGSIHATALQPKGSYRWKMLLSSGIPEASLDIPVSGEHDANNNNYLLLSVFDTSEPLQFYDPDKHDLLIVVPTYEFGRGVKNYKSTPELTVMETQQGIAVASLRDGLSTERDRTGVKIFGKSSLAISENLPVLSANKAPVPGVSAASNVMIAYDQWYVSAKEFYTRREELMLDLAQSTPSHRAEALLELVHLFMSQSLSAEADGYLELIAQQYPDFYRENKLALLTAANNLMANRIGEAQAAIAAPELNDDGEAQMWRELLNLYAPPPDPGMAVKLREQADADAAKAAQSAQAMPTEAVEEEDEEEEAGETPASQTHDPHADAAPAAAESTGEVPAAPAAEASDATTDTHTATPAPPVAAVQDVTPAPPPTFDYLKYNKPYIRFYPPKMRQRIAIIAADNYLRSNDPEKAIATFDTLHADGILKPVQPYAEYMVGQMAAAKGKIKEALRVFDKLGKQQADIYIQARARYAGTMLRLKQGMLKEGEAAEQLERVRFIWRGDGLERELLYNLGLLYEKDKQYDNTLRAWKQLLENFPADENTLTISGDMTDLFARLFLDGQADEMPPVKALALFYEFRELTPVGAKGDEMIQKLADRLAAVDLIDRATQLLEHQIRYRVSGEERARVGARLAVLYLLNDQAPRALEVLQITNFGGMPAELQRQRLQLMARTLLALDKNEEALSLLYNDESQEGALLRLDIYWKMQDWPNVINQAEDILSSRGDLTQPLEDHEMPILLKLALGYSFAGDYTQLRYLRDYYMGLLPNTNYKEIFDFVTNDTAPLDTDDAALVSKQISRTEGFLDTFRKKIAAGSLSDTIK